FHLEEAGSHFARLLIDRQHRLAVLAEREQDAGMDRHVPFHDSSGDVPNRELASAAPGNDALPIWSESEALQARRCVPKRQAFGSCGVPQLQTIPAPDELHSSWRK